MFETLRELRSSGNYETSLHSQLSWRRAFTVPVRDRPSSPPHCRVPRTRLRQFLGAAAVGTKLILSYADNHFYRLRKLTLERSARDAQDWLADVGDLGTRLGAVNASSGFKVGRPLRLDGPEQEQEHD